METKHMTDTKYTRRSFVGVCTAALVVALTGCGGGGGGGGGSTPAPTTIVTGIVRNSADSDIEVESATIVMGGITGTVVTRDGVTDANPVGSFRLENVPVGTTQATITFTNERPVLGGAPNQIETFTDTQTVAFFPAIARGVNDLEDLFVNIGQVSGRVLLASGVPAENATVAIAPDGVVTTTDANGNFLVQNIFPGAIEISAFLGTSAGTKTVTIGTGVTATGDLTMVEDPNPNPPSFPATIVGRVTPTDGTSGGGSVVLLLRDGNQIEQTIANASGDFSFYVPVGNYLVRVLKDGYLDNTASGTVTDPNTPLRLDVAVAPR